MVSRREIAAWFERALASPIDVDPSLKAEALLSLNRTYQFIGEWNRREHVLDESIRLFRQTGNQRREAHVLLAYGHQSLDDGAAHQAMAYFEQALTLYRRLGESNGVSHALGNIGSLLIEMGHHDKAESALDEAIALAATSGNRFALAGGLHSLGDLALIRRDIDTAHHCFQQTLTISFELEDKRGELHSLGGLACVAALRDMPFQAGRTWTVVTACEDQLGFRLEVQVRARYEKVLAAIGKDAMYQEGVKSGRSVSFQQAVEEQVDH